MTVTITTSGGSVLVNFTASFEHSENNRTSDYRLLVDATPVFTVTSKYNHGCNPVPMTITYLATALAAGSHTFDIEWRSSHTTNTVRQLGTTWGAGRSLSVAEVGP